MEGSKAVLAEAPGGNSFQHRSHESPLGTSAGSRDAWHFFVRTHPAAQPHDMTWVSSCFASVRPSPL